MLHGTVFCHFRPSRFGPQFESAFLMESHLSQKYFQENIKIIGIILKIPASYGVRGVPYLQRTSSSSI